MIRQLLTSTALAAACFTIAAQSTLAPQSVSPGRGMVTELGSTILQFNQKPEKNAACTEEATLTSSDGREFKVGATSGSVDVNTWDLEFGQARIVFSRTRLTNPGTYTLHIPEGFFSFNEGAMVSAAYDATYTIAGKTEVNVEPASGFIQTPPAQVVVTFPGVKSIYSNKVVPDNEGNGGMRWDTPATTIQENRGEGGEINLLEPIYDGNTVTFNVEQFNDDACGEYRLTIYAGALTLVMENGAEQQCPKIIGNYVKPLIPIPTLDPAPGEVYELGNITVSLAPGFTYGQFMRPPSLYNYVGDEKGSRAGVWVKTVNLPRGQHDLTFTPESGSAFTTPGTYRFIIGKASFSAVGNFGDDTQVDEDGNRPTGVTESWNGCEYYWEYKILPSPATGETGLAESEPVSQLDSFIIKFPNASKVEINPSMIGEADVRDRKWKVVEGHEVTYEIVETAAQSDDEVVVPQVRVNVVPPITEKGIYTVNIPEDCFYLDIVHYSRPLTQEFSVDETNDVTLNEAAVSAGEGNVYTIDGMLVLQNADEDAIKALPAGLYIAGGKKIIIK